MTTGLDVFDTSLQETNHWLKDLMDYMCTDDRREAYRALRATLHTLRDRIGAENAVHLGAQLPILVRGLYYDGWKMAAEPTRERHKQAFLDHVQREARAALDTDTETAVRAVFKVLRDRLDPGETAKLVKLFPVEMRDLWPIRAGSA